MRYGQTGFNLEIDLSKGRIAKVETDLKAAELFLGGQGAAAKILWDRVPPDVGPFSPDNLLVFSAGLLDGTPVPGANRTSVSTINPQSNFYVNSGFTGFFGPELKYAGYDAVVVRGKSPTFVYLWIQNGKVELRDASHLVGKSVLETTALLQQELKDSNVQVAAVGLAGENRVFQATIGHANTAASQRVGAVMGDKRLKAVVVRGTRDLNVHDAEPLFELCNRQYQSIYDNPASGEVFLHEEDASWHVRNFLRENASSRVKGYWSSALQKEWEVTVETEYVEQQWENYSQTMEEEVEIVTERSERGRGTGCYNCPKDCHPVVLLPGQHRYFMKSYGRLAYAMASRAATDLDYLCLYDLQEYGLDETALTSLAFFVEELRRAGILTAEDLPGFPSDGPGRFRYLIAKIARREGIGALLAEGVAEAARRIGQGAEAYGATVKGVRPSPVTSTQDAPSYLLMYATGEKAHIAQIEGSFPQAPIPDPAERQAFVAGWEAAPERFKQWFLAWEPEQELPAEAAVDVVDWNEAMHYLDDSLGICPLLSSFRGQFGGRPPYHLHNLSPFVAEATGVELDAGALLAAGRRIRQLVRAINVRRGLKRAEDQLPEGIWNTVAPESDLLDRYYAFKGWSAEGAPLKETLEQFGLGDVGEDLLRRGLTSGS